MLATESQKENTSTLVTEPKRRLALILMGTMLVLSVLFDHVSKLQAEKHLMTWTHETEHDQYQGARYHVVAFGDADAKGDDSYISLSWNYVRNLGAAWGALSTLPRSIRVPFFFAVTIVAIVIIGIYFRSMPAHHRLARWALVLILSGAIGNFLNRLTLGYVIDWIDVRWNVLGWHYFFPNFNWADICITVGVAMLMVDMLILERRRKTTATNVFTSDVKGFSR